MQLQAAANYGEFVPISDLSVRTSDRHLLRWQSVSLRYRMTANNSFRRFRTDSSSRYLFTFHSYFLLSSPPSPSASGGHHTPKGRGRCSRTGAYQDSLYKTTVASQRRAEGSPPYSENGNSLDYRWAGCTTVSCVLVGPVAPQTFPSVTLNRPAEAVEFMQKIPANPHQPTAIL